MLKSKSTYKYLDFVKFSQLYNWSVQYLNDSKIRFTTKYSLVQIKEFLTRNKTAITVQDEVTYQRVTIRVRNGGVIPRDEVKGTEIRTKKQFLVSAGQFILSKIDARNGAMGIIPKNLDGAIVTQDFLAYDIDTSKINPQYLVLVSTTKQFLDFCQRCSSGTTNRQRVDEDKFLNIQIPLPPLAEQNKLVEEYNAIIEEGNKIGIRIQSIRQKIQSYLLNVIGIKSSNNTENNNTAEHQYRYLKFTNFSDINRWDFWNQEQSVTSLLHTAKYPIVTLGSYDLTHRKWGRDTNTFRYVEIGNVEPLQGIVNAEELNTDKAPRRATQIIKEGDLIIGTTRPYLKKFAIVPSEYDGCVCSSGFQVIATNKNYNLYFLYEYLHTYLAMNQFEFYMTGALYPAITSKDLKKVLVPLPPLEIQNDIVQYIQTLKEEIRSLMQQASNTHATARKRFETQIFEQNDTRRIE